MMIQRKMAIVSVACLASVVAACASSAPSDDAPVDGVAAAPLELRERRELREAEAAPETVDAQRALAASGWTRASAEPRVERDGAARWAVVFPMERRDARGEPTRIDLVYSRDPAPAAVVRVSDAAARAALVREPESAPHADSATGCATGCDAESSSCVDWSCTYVSTTGMSFGCSTLGNLLGHYYVITVRHGRTDPSTCALPFVDVHGAVHSCPAPSDALNVLVCGWG